MTTIYVYTEETIMIDIPTDDKDGDIVRCHMDDGFLCEQCTLHYPCRLVYHASYYNQSETINIIIEDFEPFSHLPLSFVTLQLKIKVVDSGHSQPPLYVGDRPDNSCIAAQPNTVVRERFVFEVGRPDLNLIDISINPPLFGLIKHEITRSRDQIYFMFIEWRPTVIGTYHICITGTDSFSQTSHPACLTVQVDDTDIETPEYIQSTQQPNNTTSISQYQQVWTIQITKPIYRPVATKRPTFIRFINRNTEQSVYDIDIETSSDVFYQNQTLIFYTNYIFIPSSLYYITFDSGVLEGNRTSCAESKPHLDYTFWSFFVDLSCTRQCRHGIADCRTSTCRYIDDNRFTGVDCEQCRPPYYGKFCQKIPYVFSIDPSTVSELETNQTWNLTINGDNFNLTSPSHLSCRIGDKTVIPLSISNTQVVCSVNHTRSAALYTVYLLTDNGKIIESVGSIRLHVIADCPDYGCVQGQGRCAFGSCLCVYPYTGANCSIAPVPPMLKSFPNLTLAEQISFSLNLTDYLIQGEKPLKWLLESKLRSHINLASDSTILIWPAPVPSSKRYKVTVIVEQTSTGTRALQMFYIHVPFTYNISVKFIDEIANSILVQPFPRLRIVGQVQPFDNSYNLTTPQISVWIAVNNNSNMRRYLPSMNLLNSTHFETHYTPLSMEFGVLSLGGSHLMLKGIDDNLVQDSLILFGIKIIPYNNSVLNLTSEIIHNFQTVAHLINPTPIDIQNLTVHLAQSSNDLFSYELILNCTKNNHTISYTNFELVGNTSKILSNDQCGISLSILFHEPYSGLIEFYFGSTTNMTIQTSLNLQVKVRSSEVKLNIEPNLIERKVKRGSFSSDVEAHVFNRGSQTSSIIEIQMPQNQTYIQPLSRRLPPIASDDCAILTFSINIPNNTTLGTEIRIKCVVVDTSRNITASVTFRLTVVSETKINVTFLIENQLSHSLLNNHPYVSNATIRVANPKLKVDHKLISNEHGQSSIQLEADTYMISVEAMKHKSFSIFYKLLATELGQEIVISLQKEIVSYELIAKPFSNDELDIDLEAIFDKTLPIPILTLSPNLFKLDQLESEMNMNKVDLILTNNGAIQTDNVKIEFPSNHPFLKFKILQEPISSIPPNSSIIITMTIERSTIASVLRNRTCTLKSKLTWEYTTGKRQLQEQAPLPLFNGKDCAPLIPVDETPSMSEWQIHREIKSCAGPLRCSNGIYQCIRGFVKGQLGCAVAATDEQAQRYGYDKG
ncbi:unnamed protein product [Didymodactylos carnosus]|uniref:IPT/TIG domain-containing protein n=1 Tax=Didymodactylos carnosus TaxID=1234261 RepID=A0A8S2DHR8_9BILA|nr:unnamed protein product [Didymodactylos carnosus]CAF3681049.1 unnamed protein product [Didymodactylos carnosus]